jgi:LAO/AO transport system kinase
VVVLVPGTGDDVQALKAGIMEIADIFVVNKSDREGADQLVQAIAASQALKATAPGEWRPPILKTTASAGEGVPAVWAAVAQFVEHAAQSSECRTRARQAHRLREVLSAQFLQQLEHVLPPGALDRVVDRITAREIDPYSAAQALISQYGEQVSRSTPSDAR